MSDAANPKRLYIDPRKGPPRIVHLGLGAFFRAHGAIWIEQAATRSGEDWGILGVSLQSQSTRDKLQPQGWAYTAVELGSQSETAQVVTVLRGMLVAPENPQAVIDAMAAPEISIVSLTVTEKGYCHEPSTGRLNREHPDIKHDLASGLPRSAPGYLVRALEARKQAGLTPFTVLCCDNLPENGRVVRRVVLDLAELIAPDLAVWIETEGAFPSSMVDRIVPATSDDDIERVTRLTGCADAAPVMHEPFRQWVIEDRFVGGQRPDLAAVGVQMVDDVTPFEHMKLRMLNGTHSALAYLGYLAGFETISQTVSDPDFSMFVRALWRDEIIPCVATPPGGDLTQYAEALYQRYANPSIRHRVWQIAMDGSQKLPQRIFGTLIEARSAGRETSRLTLVVAAWIRYVSGRDEAGEKIDVRDPLADKLAKLWDDDPGQTVAGFLTQDDIFPAELREDLTFASELSAALDLLIKSGAEESVKHLNGH